MSESKNCIAVPAATLAIRDWDSEPMGPSEGKGKPTKPKLIQPQAGDPVDFHVKGSVDRIEGEVAYVNVAFVNSKRVELPKAKAKAEDDEETGESDEMLELAKKADQDAAEEYDA